MNEAAGKVKHVLRRNLRLFLLAFSRYIGSPGSIISADQSMMEDFIEDFTGSG